MLFFHDGEEICLTPSKIIVFNKNQPHKLKSYKSVEGYHVLHIYIDRYIESKIITQGSTCRDFYSFCSDVLEGKENGFIQRFLDIYEGNREDRILDKNIQNLKIYIDKNIDKNISLEDMSKRVNLNSSYLSRHFKKQFGLPPSRYLANRRVHLSKEMLDNGEDITQVALKLGFCDQAHFYKAFKSIFAITPNEYKTINKK